MKCIKILFRFIILIVAGTLFSLVVVCDVLDLKAVPKASSGTISPSCSAFTGIWVLEDCIFHVEPI